MTWALRSAARQEWWIDEIEKGRTAVAQGTSNRGAVAQKGSVVVERSTEG
jgi:hypothetical protein